MSRSRKLNQAPFLHKPGRERTHLMLITDASKGLADVAAGKVKEARKALSALKKRRTTRKVD